MAFAYTNSKGTTYYLHTRRVTLKGGREQQIYYFAKTPKAGTMDAVPSGYEVFESKNGLPVLRRQK